MPSLKEDGALEVRFIREPISALTSITSLTHAMHTQSHNAKQASTSDVPWRSVDVPSLKHDCALEVRFLHEPISALTTHKSITSLSHTPCTLNHTILSRLAPQTCRGGL